MTRTPARGLPPVGVLGALQLLTRIPVRSSAAPELRRCVPWFPVIGAVIGAAVGGVAVVMLELVPPSVAAAVAVVFGVALTGAFHEDGLADTADALGGWTQAQRQAILKDSRHGTYGVAALCSSIVLRIVCVAALGPAVAFGGLIAAHTLARGAAVGVMGIARPVAATGLGADYSRGLSGRATGIGVIVAVLLAAVAVGWWVAPLAAVAATSAILVAVLANRAFGGVSGDVLGAVEQVAECLALVTVSGLALHHSVWWAA